MVDVKSSRDGIVVTAFWETKPEEVGAVLEILKRFLPQAQREPGVKTFEIHQSLTEPAKFFFYEVFRDEAAFGAHQQSEHFRTLIQGEALPKLAKRERAQHKFV
ncbi:putative quinol monooxygenase [Reyranella sp.]|jgi:quinol monooxygenase YgiN|uniref:putative quinol monooxygenase n=1 Tax=Reyranella sp. TaxID=1929291 RepID=UPI002F920EB6